MNSPRRPDRQPTRPVRALTRAAIAVSGLAAGLHPVDALAYLDPGTASLVIQGVIAGIVSVAAVARLYWQKIKSLFGWRTRRGVLEENLDEADIDRDAAKSETSRERQT